MTQAHVIVMSPEELQKLVRETWDAARREAAAKEVLTLEEAGELLNLHQKIVMKYVKEKGLPAHSIGREYRFKRSEIMAWLDINKVGKVA